MFCRYCGKTLPDDSVFCDGCGRDLTLAAASPAPSSKAPPYSTQPLPLKTSPASLCEETNPIVAEKPIITHSGPRNATPQELEYFSRLIHQFWTDNPGKCFTCNLIKLLEIFFASLVVMLILRFVSLPWFVIAIILIASVFFSLALGYKLLCNYKRSVYSPEISAQIDEYRKLGINIDEYPDMPGIQGYKTLACIIVCVICAGMFQSYVLFPDTPSDSPVVNPAVIAQVPTPAPTPSLPTEYVDALSSMESCAEYYDFLSTDARQSEFLSAVAGQTVTWTGTVGEVYDDEMFPNMVVVHGDSSTGGWHNSAYAYFQSSQHDALMQLDKEDTINFTGKLTGKIEFFSFKIDNAHLN